MEQYGNTTTFNLETVLLQNIKNSPYYARKAIEFDTAYEIIDEIYNTVDNVEPWLSGNARGPSSAFCLLYRLAQIKPSAGEIREMLDHRDSPYIRAVGFLYLRYVCNPRDLWKWFKKYTRDSEQFTPSPGSLGKQITMGEFVRDIFLDQYYFETIFPRVPKIVIDEIKEELRESRLPTEPVGNAGQGGASRRGVDDGARRPASVKASLSVALGQRAPNRAGAREIGRGMGSEHHVRDNNNKRRDDRRHHDHGGRGRHNNRDRSRSRDRRYRSRSRSRDRYRSRSPRRDRDRDNYHHRRDDDRHRSSSRDRHNRSPARDGGGRDARDVFKDRAAAPVPYDKIRDRY